MYAFTFVAGLVIFCLACGMQGWVQLGMLILAGIFLYYHPEEGMK